jgi:hypothetical protein
MKGLELAQEYYEVCGRPMIEQNFPQYAGRIAAGLAGEGSDCFGFDDEISRDHDWGPSFCLWLTDADYAAVGPQLQQAYAALPGSFCGFPRRNVSEFGEGRVGPMPTSLFYQKFTGLTRAPQTITEWRRIPEHYLAVATNGKVFSDPLGKFSNIRTALLHFYPEDLRIKKIVARAAIMAQAGQYNYARCIRRSEWVAASLSMAEFTKAAFSMIYLLNKRYVPFYKWAHRGIRQLPLLSETASLFTDLFADRLDENRFRKRANLIEQISWMVICELKNQGLTDGNEDFLQAHCPKIMQRIHDPALASLHFLAE